MLDFLSAHAANDPISFHMPGHKGAALYRRFGFEAFLKKIADFDITELPGADNLFQAEGILDDLQKRYAELYEVKRSHILINGSSGGILAAILATVPKKGTLIMARNSHKSVFNALRIGDIRPVYAYPEILEGPGAAGAIKPREIETLLARHPDASAVIVPSPNYYGICSDIERIAKLVHNAGKVLIVDQAHGAHLKFFGKYGYASFPKPAEEQGADLVVNSTHKTLASFTQSALLNVCSDRADDALLEDRLQIVESTSPSYILMATLDINARILEQHGAELTGEWNDHLERFYRAVSDIDNICPIPPGKLFDHTKINLNTAVFGLSGADAEQAFIRNHRIYPELHAGDLLMFMTGVGNTKEHYDVLTRAVRDLSGRAASAIRTGNRGFETEETSAALRERAATFGGQATDRCKRAAISGEERAAVIGRPSELFPIPTETERVPLARAEGRVSAMSVIPYPPGIPLVCPGEKFSRELSEHISALRAKGEKVIGVDPQGCVAVGR
jgi:lysine decarboxylase